MSDISNGESSDLSNGVLQKSANTRELAAHKVALIERKSLDLTAMRDALSALVRQCETEQAEGLCPIISVLA